MNAIVIKSPIGNLGIEEKAGYLVRIDLFGEISQNAIVNETPVLTETKKQLYEYFNGERKKFNLPIHFDGTEFQKKVWTELMDVPYGTLISYKELAEKIGCFKGYRAVGSANHVNPLPILIPCHRVIQSNGALGGYAGGRDMKQFLIDLENNQQS